MPKHHIGAAKKARRARHQAKQSAKQAGSALDKRIAEVKAQRKPAATQSGWDRAKAAVAKLKPRELSPKEKKEQERKRKERAARANRMMSQLNKMSNQRWY